jgi:hypothetical protein
MGLLTMPWLPCSSKMLMWSVFSNSTTIFHSGSCI